MELASISIRSLRWQNCLAPTVLGVEVDASQPLRAGLTCGTPTALTRIKKLLRMRGPRNDGAYGDKGAYGAYGDKGAYGAYGDKRACGAYGEKESRGLAVHGAVDRVDKAPEAGLGSTWGPSRN